VDVIFKKKKKKKKRLRNKRKESLSTLSNEEKEHCIYTMEKEGKNVIYHIFDTTHHDSGRKRKGKEKM